MKNTEILNTAVVLLGLLFITSCDQTVVENSFSTPTRKDTTGQVVILILDRSRSLNSLELPVEESINCLDKIKAGFEAKNESSHLMILTIENEIKNAIRFNHTSLWENLPVNDFINQSKTVRDSLEKKNLVYEALNDSLWSEFKSKFEDRMKSPRSSSSPVYEVLSKGITITREPSFRNYQSHIVLVSDCKNTTKRELPYIDQDLQLHLVTGENASSEITPLRNRKHTYNYESLQSAISYILSQSSKL